VKDGFGVRSLSFGVTSVLGLLAACGVQAAPVVDGAGLYKSRCQACHSIAPAASNGVGPNLAGVFGRKAAAAPRYMYSPALKASKVVWTAQALNSWLIKPQGLVPGTKMMIAGIANPAERDALIAFLKAH
jgi:cytochrome c